ncbi:MAG: hypothetical protein QT11_C0001G0969 [archaeon GW2011_AR20]|nr:MAG: hypothetical protein QT11_C0001G0969 [archaeon GW2011_AR20]MBS3160190.1 hypothetical protein [Candidatus Woesearchaeota archaeon]
MKYLSGLEIKKRILKALKEEKEISLRRLETKLNIGYNSIKRHCQELEFFRIVNIIKHNKNARNGRPYTSIELTNYGKDLAKNS